MAECFRKIPVTLKEPIFVKGAHRSEIGVPCGRCANCLTRRKMEWAFRMGRELAKSKTAYFTTLTYNWENVPYDRFGNKILVKDDLTKFIKRLRRHEEHSEIMKEHLFNNLKPTDKLKYYAAGEYGELKQRPHFHLILFNCCENNIEKAWMKDGKPIGNTMTVKANASTIAYVMKYLDKHLDKKQDWRKPPEFNTMSEGIGADYIEEMKHWHKRNLDILYVMDNNGIRIPMPKYYRDAIFTEDEKAEMLIRVNEAIDELEAEQLDRLGGDNQRLGRYKRMKDRQIEIKFEKARKRRIID